MYRVFGFDFSELGYDNILEGGQKMIVGQIRKRKKSYWTNLVYWTKGRKQVCYLCKEKI
jgi:hypothetical protein